ncbi:MAG: YceH family protein [Acidobacteria bacterium]|nr:YceH family protein [Acidobacteriota bacterium]
MDALLNETEVRVVGSLVEKQVTTPEYYPLTLNALMHACNQTSNRDPVVSFDEKTVAHALETLREKNLVYIFYGSDSRVPKYKHVMVEIFRLTPQELAVMCVLMLRGAQTVGEVRGRTTRLYNFKDLPEVEATLEGLANRKDDEQSLVARLPRQPGRKEARYAHLLSGEVAPEPEPREPRPPRAEAATLEARAENERLAALESEVETLRRELAEMQRQFDEFRKQFE